MGVSRRIESEIEHYGLFLIQSNPVATGGGWGIESHVAVPLTPMVSLLPTGLRLKAWPLVKAATPGSAVP